MKQIKPPFYDAKSDTLFISFDDKSNSYGEDLSESVTIMKDWDTDQITGCILYDFHTLIAPPNAQYSKNNNHRQYVVTSAALL